MRRVAPDRLRPAWLCSRWGFAWPATLLPLPVVSYTTVSPSPQWVLLPSKSLYNVQSQWAIYLSVALAVGLPRPAVSRHLALWSADFPQQGVALPRSPDQPGIVILALALAIVKIGTMRTSCVGTPGAEAPLMAHLTIKHTILML